MVIKKATNPPKIGSKTNSITKIAQPVASDNICPGWKQTAHAKTVITLFIPILAPPITKPYLRLLKYLCDVRSPLDLPILIVSDAS